MRGMTWGIVAGILLVGSPAQFTRGAEAQANRPSDAAPPSRNSVPSFSANQIEELPSQNPVPQTSDPRYRWERGQWWYYLPNGRWVFWNGQGWQSAEAFATAPPAPLAPLRRGAAHWFSNETRRTDRGWVGGFYSSGGGYGSSDFGYGYGVPTYGPGSRP